MSTFQNRSPRARSEISAGTESSDLFPEKINRHPQADSDDEGADPHRRKLLRVMSAQRASDERADNHDASLLPDHRAREDEGDHSDTVDDSSEHDLQGLHGVNIGHAERGKHREVQNSQSAAEISSVDRNDQLEYGGDGERRGRSVVGDRSSGTARQVPAKHK